MKYFVKTPWWLKRYYSSYTWNIRTKEKKLFLTFDDGPHPVATPLVLDELNRFGAKATFFCLGKNVMAEPDIYRRILDEGHAVGNHTQHHLNGWKSKNELYLADVAEASKHIDSRLFRPPYGRITSFQASNISKAMNRVESKVIMWDVLSGDFDEAINGNECLENVVMNASNGSIIVFHDSEKALERVKFALPKVLEYFQKKGFQFESLNYLA